MEIAWSTMWNVTDETSENCSRFLERDGMRLFVRCLEAFPNKPELLRNMLGLLGNVAEVKELRPNLMNDAFLSIFRCALLLLLIPLLLLLHLICILFLSMLRGYEI